MPKKAAKGHHPAVVAILVVDDDAPLRRSLMRYFERSGHTTLGAAGLNEATKLLDEHRVDLVLVDFRLPDGPGPALIQKAVDQGATAAYCMAGNASLRVTSEVQSAGGHGVIEKPIDMARMAALLADHLSAGSGPTDADDDSATMDFETWRERCAAAVLGDDERLLDALHTVYSVADSECAVLVTGESGTGKELIARSLHAGSGRAKGPFVALNCAAIPDTMIEAELFGHARGAFTGAHASRTGRVAAANGGTLFLDEIGDMPLPAQAKLLRLLQEHTIIPVGSDTPVKVDLRVVAATNQDLEAMVADGKFRLDLFYRLDVIPVELPPLRERKKDIITLAEHFLRDANLRNRREVTGLDTSAKRALEGHHWPGNVRELAQLMERSVLLKRTGVLKASDLKLRWGKRKGTAPITASEAPAPLPAIEPADAPGESAASPSNAAHPGNAATTIDFEGMDLKSAMDTVERQLINDALKRTGGNRTEAAQLLGVNRTTLVEKIRKHTTSQGE